MKIEFHITQLLYRYPCVAVPGFGAFLTEIQPAQHDAETHSFYPPKKLVSFNAYLKNNDGLLASHIAQTEKTDYETALENIAKEVASWRQALQNGQQILLASVGRLSLNHEGSLVFEHSASTNFHTASFGLSSLVSPAIQREIYLQQTETPEEKAPIVLIPETRKNYGYLKYAAILVVGLGTSGFFGNQYYQNQIERQTAIVQTEVQKEVQGKIQEATFFIQNPLPNVTLSVKAEKLPYHIMAGAFRNENNAQRIYEKLSNQGFKARRLDKNKYGLFPVLFGSYANYAEAQKALKEIHQTQSREAWLLIDEL